MGGTFTQMGWQDREVKVRRMDLLEVLRKNRKQHIEDYKDACNGYREMALKRIDEIFADLRSKINGLREGQVISVVGLQFGLETPTSHEKAYDQIIRMMEMSVDEEIELTASQFGCFVMDDWEWKQNWTHSNQSYMALAKAK